MLSKRMLAALAATSLSSLGLAPLCISAALAQSAPETPPNATANPDLWPAAKSPAAITDPATEAAIDAQLAKMTVEQKVGQLIQADISAISPADLAAYPLGSILAGGNSGPYGNERATAADWARLVGEFRAASRGAGAGIPILFGVDAVHGHSNLPEATIFPHNIGLGAARDSDLIQRIGQATAAEISGSGIEWTFAPTLAVPQDLRWGRSYEGYAADPALIADYARAMTLGLQGTLVAGQPLAPERVAATAKHFLADGGTTDGRDQGDAQISEAELIAKHAQGYPASIDAGALTVMASFSSWNGVKHHGNASLLTGVLKDRMGFAGLVVGDWNGHGQIPGCSKTDCPAAINAGLDLFMAPDSWKELYTATLSAAKDGSIARERLDDAVRRIVRVKYKLGLMGDAPTPRGDTRLLGTPAHLDLAREAAAKSLVLLKNNGSVLPVKPGANVLIAGSGADDMAMQAGGWTISWQGTDTTAADFPNGQTIGRAIAEAVTGAGGKATMGVAAPSSTANPDVAIVVLGEKPYAEFEGDVPHLAFRPLPDDTATITRLKAAGVPVVVLFLSGRPMFTGPLINQADAFVAAWLPGTQGRGVADVLVAGKDGKTARGFTGRLPFAWPLDARHNPDAALFPAGYGLDYTKATTLAPVNEDAGVDLSATAHIASYMVRGKVPAPWHLSMEGSISARAVDLSAQEDARQFRWTADGAMTINGPAVDLTQQLANNQALLIEWRIDERASGPVSLAFGGTTVSLDTALAAAESGTVQRTHVALRCFVRPGGNLASVGSPFQLTAPKGFAATIRTVGLTSDVAPAACPPAPATTTAP